MRLIYHEGQNFGDALNPLVFGSLFPSLLDSDDSVQLLGFGSILGLKRPAEKTRRRIIFSSGYGANQPSTYGPPPKILRCDDVLCVRGPRTAALLGLPPSAAVADGAILAASILKTSPLDNAGAVSFMPHVGSFWCFEGWSELLGAIGIELIDPRHDPLVVLAQLARSRLVIAEAMHGAILADAIGVPWIPVKCYKSVNEFKWNDFCESMDLRYEPTRLPQLFDRRAIDAIMKSRLSRSPAVGQAAASRVVALLHATFVRRRVQSHFRHLLGTKPLLSRREVLAARIARLLECADDVRRNYA